MSAWPMRASVSSQYHPFARDGCALGELAGWRKGSENRRDMAAGREGTDVGPGPGVREHEGTGDAGIGDEGEVQCDPIGRQGRGKVQYFALMGCQVAGVTAGDIHGIYIGVSEADLKPVGVQSISVRAPGHRIPIVIW